MTYYILNAFVKSVTILQWLRFGLKFLYTNIKAENLSISENSYIGSHLYWNN